MTTLVATKFYFDSIGNCAGTPNVLMMTPDSDCANDTCKVLKDNDAIYYSSSCITSSYDYAAEVYDSDTFVLIEAYNTTGCEDLVQVVVNLGNGVWQLGNSDRTSRTRIKFDAETGAVNLQNSASDTNSSYNYTVNSSEVSTRESPHCVMDGKRRVYTSISLEDASTSASASQSRPSTSDSSIGIGAIIGIIVAVLVAVVLLIAGCIWCRRRSKDEPERAYAKVASPVAQKSIDTGTTDFSSSIGLGPQSLASLWDDEIIATSRIPREKVLAQQLINRGGYGEVYYGLYNGQRVALKMLLPELRKSIKHVNEFLDEVRLMALLDHPRIVRLVGVAWDSLSDLCAVLEYMEGGDLRGLLSLYDAQNHPLGFDYTKVTIALHVAHALTYLHSLDPPVLHRDLKSKNILLTTDLQAKVTDFGISRERGDKTMTAGVGTSLWMAPEVMMGESYDGKADIFSFGVVLSELDMHTLPYSHAKENSNSGRKVPDTAILQMVAQGNIRVAFSSEALESMVVLGYACVSVDPNDRPTAAEALYRLQRILRDDL